MATTTTTTTTTDAYTDSLSGMADAAVNFDLATFDLMRHVVAGTARQWWQYLGTEDAATREDVLAVIGAKPGASEATAQNMRKAAESILSLVAQDDIESGATGALRLAQTWKDLTRACAKSVARGGQDDASRADTVRQAAGKRTAAERTETIRKVTQEKRDAAPKQRGTTGKASGKSTPKRGAMPTGKIADTYATNGADVKAWLESIVERDGAVSDAEVRELNSYARLVVAASAAVKADRAAAKGAA